MSDPNEPSPTGSITHSVAPAGRLRARQALLLPMLAVVTALVIGALLMVFTDETALKEWAGFFREPGEALSASWAIVRDSYSALFTGAFGHPTELASAIGSGDLDRIQSALGPLSETIVAATPLILVGLSVAIAFHSGLFNIGAEGQMNVGAIVASMFGFSFSGLPEPLHLALMVLGGFMGGALWGFVPGLLKARTGAHEVITTIMLNFIAVSLALYLLQNPFFRLAAEPRARPVEPSFPLLFGSGLRAHVGILFAIAVALGVAWLLNRTTVGFEFRAVGLNPDASRAAGMSPTRTTVTVMTLAGGLSGLAGANQLASVTPSLIPGFASGLGFDGIAIALLARARPIGVVFAAFLFGALRSGGRSMQIVTQTPIDIIVVIQALVIVFVAAPALVRAIYRLKEERASKVGTFAKGWGA